MYKGEGIFYFLKVFLLYAILSKAFGQKFPYHNDIEKKLKINPVPDTDTSINVNELQYKQYIDIIHRLYKIDQKYREIIENEIQKNGETDQIENLRIMKINDRANEIFFLKLLKKFGWPKNANDEILFESWIIVWHSEEYYKKQFKTFVYDSLMKGYITKEYYDSFKFTELD